MSFDVILPFLRPIAHLILDPEVSEVMVNGSQRVFVERAGLMQEAVGVALDPRHVTVAVKNIARALGDDISEESPSSTRACRTVRVWRPSVRRVASVARR